MLTALLTIFSISAVITSVMVICALRAPDDGWEQPASVQLDVLSQHSPNQAK